MRSSGSSFNGGGQPVQAAPVHKHHDLRELRAKPLYNKDKSMSLRKSHENPLIKEIYEAIGEPGGDKAHKWLHTSHKARPKYKTD